MMKNFLNTLGFNTDHPGDLEDFTNSLLNLLLWIFVIAASIVMIYTLVGDGSLPPEPQWWIEFRSTLLK